MIHVFRIYSKPSRRKVKEKTSEKKLENEEKSHISICLLVR